MNLTSRVTAQELRIELGHSRRSDVTLVLNIDGATIATTVLNIKPDSKVVMPRLSLFGDLILLSEKKILPNYGLVYGNLIVPSNFKIPIPQNFCCLGDIQVGLSNL